MREEVLSGLRRTPKVLSPKFFYDQRGSELFERICELEEYYLTRTEQGILEDHAAEMAEFLGRGCRVFEFGSGSSRKTKLLLRHLQKGSVYLPVDISRTFLMQTAEVLSREFPDLEIVPVCADFTAPFECGFGTEGEVNSEDGKPFSSRKHKAVFFPGSTIGNFEPMHARDLLEDTASFLGHGGRMIIGVDLAKDPRVIEAAYNDSQGITAEFNLNILTHLNRVLGADFQTSHFVHRAYFNFLESRAEMHLICQESHDVKIGGEIIGFKAGESIHTENSYKYAPATFVSLAHGAGFRVLRAWMDPRNYFAVFGLESIKGLAISAEPEITKPLQSHEWLRERTGL